MTYRDHKLKVLRPISLVALFGLGACGGNSTPADPVVDGVQGEAPATQVAVHEVPNASRPMTEAPAAANPITAEILPAAELSPTNNAPSLSGNPIVVTTSVVDEVEAAVRTGDASLVSSSSFLEDAVLDAIEQGRDMHRDALIEILNLDASGLPRSDGGSLTDITWNPTHDASLLVPTFGENTALLTTNAVIVEGYEVKREAIGVLGTKGGRYIVLGGNPMRNYRRDGQAINEQMHLVLENSLAWLTQRSDLQSNPLNVVAANLDQSYYFPDELAVREWLDLRFPQVSYNAPKSCDDAALAACTDTQTDLLIVSQHTDTSGGEQAAADAVAQARALGVPVLYLHHDGGLTTLGKGLLALFDTSYSRENWWHRLGISRSDQSSNLGRLPASIESVQVMITNLHAANFEIDWATEENGRSDVEELSEPFQDGASHVQTMMRELDASKKNIFATPDRYRLGKLLALLGDHYRQDVMFPMDKHATPETTFLKAYYADHSQYQFRDKVGVWGDLGNFSRVDFSHITPTSRTVNHISKRNFRSTGAYALPGETVTVTRKDNSEVGVAVFVNSTRSGSTHVYDEYGYKRPRYMRGQSMPILPGETIRFTSAIGGPIQLSYDTNDLPVEVAFENIGEHPYWSREADNETFTAKLAAAEFDWAEIAAPSFEVHSKTDKMVQSIQDPVLLDGVGVPQALVDAVMRYVHNFPHVLAGFQGPGIDVVEEIHQFATDNGLPVDSLDLVKHMNADQASCGYGCSGNPYDAYWSFSPLGHGDIHELGHGLERDRFRLTGWPGHSSTNFYSYYSKTRYYETTGVSSACQALPFETLFNSLQESVGQSDPTAYLQRSLWGTSNGPVAWSIGTATIIQMMMAAEDNGALVDGWHLLARLHLIERGFQRSVNSDEAWLSARDGLGMSLYELTDARDMSREDWLLIAVSKASGFDFRSHFEAWGLIYSVDAASQVAAHAFPSMPVNFYVSTPSGYCTGEGFDGTKLPLDGVQTWPLTAQ